VLEFLSRGGTHSTIALLAVGLTWAAALARMVWIGRDYKSASAGGWLVLGGTMAISLAAATMVPPHTSILMTVYAGLGPPLLLLMGMAGLLLLDGMGSWLNPPAAGRRIARWGGMALILAGLGLLMELRGALSLHMGLSELSSQPLEEQARATERWFMLARNAGVVASMLGLALTTEGTIAGLARAAPSAPPDDA